MPFRRLIIREHRAPEPVLVPVTSFSWRAPNMSRTARLWRGAGFLVLGGLLLPGRPALADAPPLSQQLTDRGRQALSQGAAPTAETFFQKALKLDPNNKQAAQGLEQLKQGQQTVRRVATQD